MPPRGGRADLSLEEFARAVACMARAGGGNWEDPDARMLDLIREEEKKRIEQLRKKISKIWKFFHLLQEDSMSSVSVVSDAFSLMLAKL
jgi:hypothetical protein